MTWWECRSKLGARKRQEILGSNPVARSNVVQTSLHIQEPFSVNDGRDGHHLIVNSVNDAIAVGEPLRMLSSASSGTIRPANGN